MTAYLEKERRIVKYIMYVATVIVMASSVLVGKIAEKHMSFGEDY
jgi:hypothetical protein